MRPAGGKDNGVYMDRGAIDFMQAGQYLIGFDEFLDDGDGFTRRHRQQAVIAGAQCCNAAVAVAPGRMNDGPIGHDRGDDNVLDLRVGVFEYFKSGRMRR
ncbi:MAG: hypothetical protein CVU74_04460 [Deltaproteobacteria bacterium HGW-Deltaproteobacteria-9]|nr:MAG: hypothetical protein CVU74_04460 [Deltaproteobacteria bacterium HGW-Deltaproteobacteria-9]